jgi:hypothetical protein
VYSRGGAFGLVVVSDSCRELNIVGLIPVTDHAYDLGHVTCLVL